MGEHPRTEDSDFILYIEGLPKLKCKQASNRSNVEAQQVSHGGIPEVYRGDYHMDYGAGIR